MHFRRIKALVLKQLSTIAFDINRTLTATFWPVFDVMIWGYTSAWFGTISTSEVSLLHIMLAAAIFWQITVRANQEYMLQLLNEIDAHNIANLFGSPLTIYDWICSSFIITFITAVLTTIICALTSWLLFDFNFFVHVRLMCIMIPLAYLSALWIGISTTTLLMRFGRSRVESICWIFSWLFIPLSGAFWNLDIMPQWIQAIAWSMPMAYVFTGLRTAVQTGEMPVYGWTIGLLLSLVYLVASLYFFICMFEKRRELGLSYLDQ